MKTSENALTSQQEKIKPNLTFIYGFHNSEHLNKIIKNLTFREQLVDVEPIYKKDSRNEKKKLLFV